MSCRSKKYPKMAAQKTLKLSYWQIVTNAVHPYSVCYEQYVRNIYIEETSFKNSNICHKNRFYYRKQCLSIRALQLIK